MGMTAKQISEILKADESSIQESLDVILDYGLVVLCDDGTYEITEAGIIALDLLDSEEQFSLPHTTKDLH